MSHVAWSRTAAEDVRDQIDNIRDVDISAAIKITAGVADSDSIVQYQKSEVIGDIDVAITDSNIHSSPRGLVNARQRRVLRIADIHPPDTIGLSAEVGIFPEQGDIP